MCITYVYMSKCLRVDFSWDEKTIIYSNIFCSEKNLQPFFSRLRQFCSCFIKGKHYSYKTLSVIFLFRRNYPYNPYINRKSLNSLKYCATEALPVLTYILNCCITRSRWNHQFFTQQMHIHEIRVQNQRLQKEFYTRRPRVSGVINHQLICMTFLCKK